MAASAGCGFLGQSINHQDTKALKPFEALGLRGETVRLSNGLDQLNSIPAEGAAAEFVKCCGSVRWARAMTNARPFENTDELLNEADRIWWSLDSEDWLEAFRAHPKIGEQKAAQEASVEARAWSEQEQSSVQSAPHGTMQALAAGNREYEQTFGYIFIVCATGKSSDEMLAILQERLNNDRDKELRVAAEEQRKITQLRLVKLINSLES
jgi:OHCU decarboxylase